MSALYIKRIAHIASNSPDYGIAETKVLAIWPISDSEIAYSRLTTGMVISEEGLIQHPEFLGTWAYMKQFRQAYPEVSRDNLLKGLKKHYVTKSSRYGT